MDFGVSKFRRLLFVSCAGLASTNLIDLTDTMVAGNLLGEKALAAMNLFWPCIDLQFFLCMAVASGTAILYSRAVGDFDARRAENVFSNGLILAGLVGLALGTGLWFLRAPAVAFYGVTGETLGYLTDYWKVFAIEVVIFPVYVYLNTMVVSDGDSRIGTLSFSTELCVNAVASYFLCRAYGIAGCAMGSIVSTLSGMAVASTHFLRKTNSLTFRWHFSLRDSLSAFLADLPEASVSLFTAIVYVVMNKMLIIDFGEGVLPVMTAVIAANGFVLFLYGVPPAAQPIVNVYWTEGNYGSVRRVMRAALATSLALGVLTGLAFALFPGVVVRLIGVTTPEIVLQSCAAIRIVACSYPFVAVTALFTAYYLYVERAVLSVSMVALQSVVLPILLSAAGAWVLGENGFWIGYAAASPLAVLLFFAVLKLVCRDRLEAPPWFLDLTRDVYTTTWALRTEPADICRVAEGVMERLRNVEAPARALAKASLLVEDMLMAIRERNGGKAVLAEVQLDIRSTGGSDGHFDARLLMRDDGAIVEREEIATLEAQRGNEAFRNEMLDKVMKKLSGRRSRVTTGFNRQEFVL